jgi:hypothetical protein
VQIERPMCLRAVQEDRDGRDRDVREHDRHDDVTPPWQRHQAVGDER